MTIETTCCRHFRHPEFLLEADERHVPRSYLDHFAHTIEEMVAHGSVFRPGQTFQIGWILTNVLQHDRERLTLQEPDMQSMPIKPVPGITHTLRTLMLQLSMLDSVSLRQQMLPAVMTDSLIVCTQYTQADFFMHRCSEPRQRDSGWFIGCLAESHDHNNPLNLRRVPLYEAFLKQRGVQGFLSFPVGSMIVFDQQKGMSILKDGEPLDIAPNSLLETWFAKQHER